MLATDFKYPTVDIGFIEDQVLASGKLAVDGIFKFGSTTSIIMEGSQAIYKRTTTIRELEPGQICLEQATALALKYSFLGNLLQWLEENKNWKEGAYKVVQVADSSKNYN